MVLRVWISAFLVAESITTVAAVHRPRHTRLSAGRHRAGQELDTYKKPVARPQLEKCPGSIPVAGYGRVALVRAAWNRPSDSAGDVQVKREKQDKVVAQMKSRAYFGDDCTHDDNNTLAGMHLFGKSLRYTVDLSGAGCGCNVALSISPLQDNRRLTECGDYFCDANRVCGVSCAEIDIQEANMYTFLTTLHTQNDHSGTGKGKSSGHRDWTSEQYGPGASCINTLEPFNVTASFPASADNVTIKGIVLSLSQTGRSCSPLETRISSHCPPGYKCPLSMMLKGGVTPIVSYWGIGEDLRWFDSPDGFTGKSEGRCDANKCGASVKFYNFAVEEYREGPLAERRPAGAAVVLDQRQQEDGDTPGAISYNEAPHDEPTYEGIRRNLPSALT